MSESILEKIDREQAGGYIFKLSLFGFLIVLLSIVALVIKIFIFSTSSSKGFVIFISRNLLLSIILLVSSHYTKKKGTKFAVSFDKASGPVKLFWIIGFVMSVAIIYEFLHLALSKIV